MLSPAPEADGEASSQLRPLPAVLSLAVGLVGLLCALALPFAPVLVKQATVTWPAAGAAPRSTTAFLVPYEPAGLRAQVPCRVIRQALAGRLQTTVLATAVSRGGRPSPGLEIVTTGGRIRVQVAGRPAMDVPAPAGTGCGVAVHADATSTTVTLGERPPVRLATAAQVSAFVTGLRADQATGMTVSARARNWFEAAPTTAKTALIAAQLLLAAVSIFLLYRAGRRLRQRAPARTPARTPGPGPAPARRTADRAPARPVRFVLDAAVLGVLALWLVIGPLSGDDGYATMTIRNAEFSGDIGNYFHWFNASEAPFTLLQRLLQPLAAISVAPVWLRAPSVLFGMLTWFVISRGILNTVLPEHGRRTAVRALTAVTFLAWWLPFCMGVRPESLVTLGLAATMALLLRGTAPAAFAAGLPQTGLAVLIGGLTLSVTPSGVLVLAPFLALAPRLWRVLTAGLPRRFPHLLLPLGARLALLACAAGTGMVSVFAMQSLHGLQMATKQHNDIGPRYSFYEEYVRYDYLLGGGLMGSATKRLAVLISLVLLATTAVLIMRGARRLPGLSDAHLPTIAAFAAFLLLWLTPSKWSHHFGSLAGLAVPFLVVAIVAMTTCARRRFSDPVVLLTGLAGTALVAAAAAVSFVGANTWGYLSTYGVLWAKGPVRPFGLPLDNPVCWVLPPLIVLGIGYALRGRAGGNGGWTVRPALAAAPAVAAATALTASVGVLLAGFIAAPIRQDGGHSLAAQNMAHITGGGCGIADKVEVKPDIPGGVLGPLSGPGGGPAGTQGFLPGGGFLATDPPVPAPGAGPARHIWGSLVPNGAAAPELSTGALTTPWFRLPKLTAAQELAVTVSGRTGGTNSLELEFAGPDPGAAGVSRLNDGRTGVPRWRPLAVAAAAVPAGADRVRIRAVDRSVDVGGWLATTGPRIREAMRLTDFLARHRGPVLPDWQMAAGLPCVRRFPKVAHGVAQAPTVLIEPPGRRIAADFQFIARQGGSFNGVITNASITEMPSRLIGGSSRKWGHVALVHYPFARDAYRVSTRTVRVSGREGDE